MVFTFGTNVSNQRLGATFVRVGGPRLGDAQWQTQPSSLQSSRINEVSRHDSCKCHSDRQKIHIPASHEYGLSDLDASRGEWVNSDSPHTEALCQRVDSCESTDELSRCIQQSSSRMSAFVAARVASQAERLLREVDVTSVERQSGMAEITKCISSHISSMSSSGLINVLSLALLLSKHPIGQGLAAEAVAQLPPSSVASTGLYLRHFVQLLIITSAFTNQSQDRKSSLGQSMGALSRSLQDHVTAITPSSTVRDAVTACKIIASFRHRHHIPSAILHPVCVALATHAERSLLEYNATQLIIALTSLHACGHAPKPLYSAVTSALASDRLGYLSIRHRVSLLDAFDTAGQPLPAPLRHTLVSSALDACATLTHAEDVARLARAAGNTSGLPPARGLPVAEYLVRHAVDMPPADVAAALAALLRLGCVHGGAIAAFRGAAAPRLGDLRWWELRNAACCCANPECVRFSQVAAVQMTTAGVGRPCMKNPSPALSVEQVYSGVCDVAHMHVRMQADLWPQVRSAAGRAGRVTEAAVTAAFVAALIRDTATVGCQRVSDAAAALTTLLQSGLASAGDRGADGGGAGGRAAAPQLQAELEALLPLLADGPPATPELQALLATAAAEAGAAGRRRRQRAAADGVSRWASADDAVRWLQAARPAEVVHAVRVAAEAASDASASGQEPAADIRAAVFSAAQVRTCSCESACISLPLNRAPAALHGRCAHRPCSPPWPRPRLSPGWRVWPVSPDLGGPRLLPVAVRPMLAIRLLKQ